jgi:YesN/AraC family two-component response regulator
MNECEKLDIILMDIDMPGKNGIILIKEILEIIN